MVGLLLKTFVSRKKELLIILFESYILGLLFSAKINDDNMNVMECYTVRHLSKEATVKIKPTLTNNFVNVCDKRRNLNLVCIGLGHKFKMVKN